MRRRALLAAATGLAGGAGCSGRFPVPMRTPGSAADPPPLDALSCPPARVRDDAVCAHLAENPPVVVRADERAVPLSAAERVTFTLRNDSGEALRFNPNNPAVYRWVARGWSLLERRSSGSGVVTVGSGDEYRWRLGDLPQFDRLDAGTFLFGTRVPYDGWTQLFAPFRLTDG